MEKTVSSYSFCQALDDAGVLTLENPYLTHIDAFIASTEKLKENMDPSQLDMPKLLKELEDYVRAKSRVDLIKAITETKIDIFGKAGISKSWTKFFKGHPNITVHDPVPYWDTFKIMRESKIVLNSNPNMKYGAHERVFSALISGALTVTNENPFIREFFTDKENIGFYRTHELDTLDKTLQGYLNDEALRQKVHVAGQKIVKEHHTWDHRIPGFLRFLEINI